MLRNVENVHYDKAQENEAKEEKNKAEERSNDNNPPSVKSRLAASLSLLGSPLNASTASAASVTSTTSMLLPANASHDARDSNNDECGVKGENLIFPPFLFLTFIMFLSVHHFS